MVSGALVVSLLPFAREQEAKFVQDRISNVEKHFAELCTAFAAYTRKAARFVYNDRCTRAPLYRLFILSS